MPCSIKKGLVTNDCSIHVKGTHWPKSVAVNVVDPDNTRRYFAVRGRVIATTTEGGAQSIDEISGKYLGRPYPNFSGRPETRMIMTIEADSVRGMGAR